MRAGFITIGQSPRIDVVPEMKSILGKDVIIVERGALDGLSPEEIQGLSPEEGEYVLVTRLLNGRQVTVSRERITERMQRCIDILEREVDAIGILCTGEFPELRSNTVLIEPSLLLLKTVEAVRLKNSLGVLVPSVLQIPDQKGKWAAVGVEVCAVAVSPYTGTEGEIEKAGAELRECDLIVLDCMGYNLRTRRIIRDITEKPVLLPRMLMARLIEELYGE